MNNTLYTSDINYNKAIFLYRNTILGPSLYYFKKCIEYKEIQSYKACYLIAKIYVSLKDFILAYRYCYKALRLNPQYFEALYYIAHILKLMKLPFNDYKQALDKIFNKTKTNTNVIAHIFYIEGYYDTALYYIEFYSADKVYSYSEQLFAVKCLIRCSKYNECIKYINTISEDNNYYFSLMMYKLICFVIKNDSYSVLKILYKFRYERLTFYNKKKLSVYFQFYNLTSGNNTSVLSEDENDLSFTPIIFEILDILLTNHEFDCFEKSLNLINLISDKTVLLQLGKLYYKHGYIELAKKEILRSIKLFDVFDKEGLDILD